MASLWYLPRETDSILQMITLTEETLWLAYCKKAKQGLEFIKKLITLTEL